MLDFAKSTTTAEHVAASMAKGDVTITRSILSELGILAPTTDSYEDNSGATMIVREPGGAHKTMYLGLHWYYVQERVSRNEIRYVWFGCLPMKCCRAVEQVPRWEAFQEVHCSGSEVIFFPDCQP
jgi:hypothetical protein